MKPRVIAQAPKDFRSVYDSIRLVVCSHLHLLCIVSAGDEWIHAMLDSAAPRLKTFTCQGLVNMLWSVAALSAPVPVATLAALLHACVQAGPRFSSQDMSNALWAMAQLYQQCMQETSDVGKKQCVMLQRAAARVLDACSTEQKINTSHWWSHVSSTQSHDAGNITAGGTIARKPQRVVTKPAALATATQQQLANTVWAVSELSLHVHPAWCSLFYSTSKSRLQQMTAQELASTLHGVAKLHIADMQNRHVGSSHFQSVAESSTDDGTSSKDSIDTVDNTLLPGQEWWSAWCDASAVHMVMSGPQELVMTVVAVTRLGLQPGQQWYTGFMQQV